MHRKKIKGSLLITKRKLVAIILAGGFGTRLRSVVADRQKTVADVCGKPFLCFLLDQVGKARVRECILACGYQADTVKAALKDYPDLKYSVERKPLGTGGALRLALKETDAEWILSMNGDSFLAVDLCDFIAAFEKSGRDAGMVLTHVGDVSRYGSVVLENGTVRSFLEKGAVHGAGLVNAGIYIFHRKILESIPEDTAFSLERELFPGLSAEAKLFGYVCDGAFIDIGTPESYTLAQTFLKGH